MRLILLLTLVGSAVILSPAISWAAAGSPPRLDLTAPSTVGIGEEILVEVRLTGAEDRPVAGATLTLLQVGAVGQRPMATATTDASGAAYFQHNEFTIPVLTLRVAFAGDAAHAPANRDFTVEVTGIAAAPAVVMSHTPSPLVKSVIFLLLGTVWLTYMFAASSVLRIVREGRTRQGGEMFPVARP